MVCGFRRQLQAIVLACTGLAAVATAAPLAYIPNNTTDCCVDMKVVDLADDAVLFGVQGFNNSVLGVAAAPGVRNVYVISTSSHINTYVDVLDAATATKAESIGPPSHPLSAIVVHPSRPLLYIGRGVVGGGGHVTAVDTTDGSTIAEVLPAETSTIPSYLALSADGTRLYATIGREILVVDTTTHSVLSRRTLGASADTLLGVAGSSDGSRIYVVNATANSVVVLDATATNILATIPVGLAPNVIITSGQRAYVVNRDSNSVSVIDGSTNTVIATVLVGTGPQGIDIEPSGQRAYVPNAGEVAGSRTVSVIDLATNSVLHNISIPNVGAAFGRFIGGPTATHVVNFSTRGEVGTGNDVVIGGFIIGGSSSKTVAIVATGPSLAAYGVANPLANPTLTLVRSSDGAIIAGNDDWGSAANASQIQASGFAPSSPLESAILINLPPGGYTAILSGAGGATGVGVVAVNEVDRPEVPLVNISTRGQVLTGDKVMIAGFVIDGNTSMAVVITAAGPSLAPYGIANPLMNPMLTLVRSSDQSIIATNDDWQSQTNAGDVAAIQATGFQPNNAAEPAIVATLPPGAYTAIVQGVGGGTGVGLVGVFRDDQDFTIRSQMTELIYTAEVCKTSVAEYYQAKGVFPSGGDSVCSTFGTANSSPPIVTADTGAIRVTAQGYLASYLTAIASQLDFAYTPVLAGGAGSAIQAWDCKTNTTIAARYLPAVCR